MKIFVVFTQILMSVLLQYITAIEMLIAIIREELSPVPVELGLKGTEPHAQVCTGLATHTSISRLCTSIIK